MTRRLLLAVAVLLVGAATAACGTGGTTAEERPSDGRLAMVSGRDDHGLLAAETVAILDGPDSGHQVGTLADGTIVQAVGAEATWQQIRTVEGEPMEGWINDFYLRGQLRLVGPPPTCSARIGAHTVEGGTLVTIWQVNGDRVLVEGVADTHLRGWASRDDVQELPPQGTDCGEDPPGEGHTH